MLGDRAGRKVVDLFAILYFIATHENVQRADVIEFIRNYLQLSTDLSPREKNKKVTDLTVTRQVRLLKNIFKMRITWSHTTGYVVRTWGLLDKDKFFELAPEMLPDFVLQPEKKESESSPN